MRIKFTLSSTNQEPSHKTVVAAERGSLSQNGEVGQSGGEIDSSSACDDKCDRKGAGGCGANGSRDDGDGGVVCVVEAWDGDGEADTVKLKGLVVLSPGPGPPELSPTPSAETWS